MEFRQRVPRAGGPRFYVPIDLALRVGPDFMADVSKTVDETLARLGLPPGVAARQRMVVVSGLTMSDYRDELGLIDAIPAVRQPDGQIVIDIDATFGPDGYLNPAVQDAINVALACNAAQHSRALAGYLPIRETQASPLPAEKARAQFAHDLYRHLQPAACAPLAAGSREARRAERFSELIAPEILRSFLEAHLLPEHRHRVLRALAVTHTLVVYADLVEDALTPMLPKDFDLLEELAGIQFFNTVESCEATNINARIDNPALTEESSSAGRFPPRSRLFSWLLGCQAPLEAHHFVFHELVHLATNAMLENFLTLIARRVPGRPENLAALTLDNPAHARECTELFAEPGRAARVIDELFPEWLVEEVLGLDRFAPDPQARLRAIGSTEDDYALANQIGRASMARGGELFRLLTRREFPAPFAPDTVFFDRDLQRAYYELAFACQEVMRGIKTATPRPATPR